MPRPTAPIWGRTTLLLLNAVMPPVALTVLATVGGAVGGAVLAFTLGLHGVLLWGILHPRCDWLTPVIQEFAPLGDEVWLTIDDGPDGQRTRALSAALRERGVPATFFVIGERLAKEPEVAGVLQQDGHNLANHTYSHPRKSFWCSARATVVADVERCSELLRDLGCESQLFRPPVGHKPPALARVLAERGLHPLAWTVGGRDGWADDPEGTVHRFVAGVRPGAIITMHEGREFSNETILAVVDALLERGFQFVLPSLEQITGHARNAVACNPEATEGGSVQDPAVAMSRSGLLRP